MTGRIFTIVLAGLLVAPAFTVVLLSFSHSSFFDAGFGTPSLRWYAAAFSPRWLESIALSAGLALTTALVTTAVAIPAAFVATRTTRHNGWVKALDLLVLATILVPPISLAVGYFRLFGEGNFPALWLSHLVLGLAFPYFSLRMGSQSVSTSLVDAAQLLGASPTKAMIAIWLPSIRRHALLGFVLAFLTSWDETVLSIFITDPATLTLPKAIWEAMSRERDLTAAAINTVVAPCLSLLVVWLHAEPSQARVAQPQNPFET